jgi:regulatory protein
MFVNLIGAVPACATKTRVYKKRSAKPKIRLPLQQRALALAARKLRSIDELRKKLLAEEYAADEIETVLARLGEIHLVDDNLVAHSISRQYKDRGNRFITQKMKSKGISAEEHESAFEELPDEFERALAAGEKKMRSLKTVEPRAAGQKLYQHLAVRGFSGGIVQKVVRQLTAGVEFDE